MPNQEDAEKAALEYGMLVTNTRTVREEKAQLESDCKALADQRTMLNEEIGKTQDGISRVRSELMEAEKQLEAARQMKLTELENEKRLVEDQRQKLSKASQELKEVEDVLSRRELYLETRERNFNDAQAILESRVRRMDQEMNRLDIVERETGAMRELLNEKERKLQNAENETAQRLRAAQDIEESSRSLQSKNKEDIQNMENEKRLTATRLIELSGIEERTNQALKEVQLFDEVAKEAVTFIQQNVKNYDAIANYFEKTFPALINRLQNV